MCCPCGPQVVEVSDTQAVYRPIERGLELPTHSPFDMVSVFIACAYL